MPFFLPETNAVRVRIYEEKRRRFYLAARAMTNTIECKFHSLSFFDGV